MNHFVPSEPVREQIKKIGRDLKIARKRRQKTIQVVAEMTGVSVSTVKRLENGDPSVKFGVYLAIVEVFQLQDSVRFAEPEADVIGLTLEKQRMPQRVRRKKDERLDF